MTPEFLLQFTGYCTLVNYAILLLWFLAFIFKKESIYQIHTVWFQLSAKKFDQIHYFSMALFKVFIFIFNLAPYIALRIIL